MHAYLHVLVVLQLLTSGTVIAGQDAEIEVRVLMGRRSCRFLEARAGDVRMFLYEYAYFILAYNNPSG